MITTTQQQSKQLQSSQREPQQKPSLGVSGVNINPEIAEAMNLTQTSGFLVVDIIAQGPAYKAGLRGGFAISNINGTEVQLGGDVITGIDNTTVSRIDDILSYLDTKKVGDTVNLKIFRDNRVEDIPLTLGPSQNTTSNLSLPPDSDIPWPAPETPGSSDDAMKEFYDNCVDMIGEDLCGRLFGGGR